MAHDETRAVEILEELQLSRALPEHFGAPAIAFCFDRQRLITGKSANQDL
jgi:hypothetical protein